MLALPVVLFAVRFDGRGPFLGAQVTERVSQSKMLGAGGGGGMSTPLFASKAKSVSPISHPPPAACFTVVTHSPLSALFSLRPSGHKNAERSSVQCAQLTLLRCCPSGCHPAPILPQQVKSTRGRRFRRCSRCAAPAPAPHAAVQWRDSAASASRAAYLRLPPGACLPASTRIRLLLQHAAHAHSRSPSSRI